MGSIVIADRAKETSTTSGTGTYTTDGAVTGFQTLLAAVGSGNKCYYCVTDGTNWETGIGTVTSGSLTRDVITASSNSGSAVNWNADEKDVFIVNSAEAINKTSRYVATTATATANQYAKLRTYSFPAGNNVAAKSTLLLTPIGDSAHYQPIEIEVIAKQGTSGLDTTNAQINVIRNSEEAVLYNDFDLVIAAATNGTDIMLWMRSAVAAKYAVQVLSEEFDTDVSVANHDGATWTADNPLTTPAPAASVTSTWAGSGEIEPTLGSGWSAGSGCFYKKTVDGQVIVHLFASGSGTDTDGTVLFTLPSGFRPKLQYHTPMVANSSGWGTAGMMYITPAGAVQIYGVSAASPSELAALAIFEVA